MMRHLAGAIAASAILAASLPAYAAASPAQIVAPCVWEAGVLLTVPSVAPTVATTCLAAAAAVDNQGGPYLSLDVWMLARAATAGPVAGSPAVDTSYWLDSVRSDLVQVEADLS